MTPRIIGLVVLALLSLGEPAAMPAENIRVAVIVADESVQSASDLLTTRLSHQEGIVVLERDKVDVVLREQRLSLGGLSSKKCLEVGQLLGADGLFMLEQASGRQPPRVYLRLVAVKTGVVLEEREYPWPLPDQAEWPKQVWLQFRSLVPKLKVSLKEAVPLSVVNLRSSVTTASSKRYEDELTRVVIQRLSRETEVFVLERSRLQNVAFEKELRPEDDSGFWTGRYLLDGTLDSDGFDPAQATLRARLTPPQGGVPMLIEVKAPRGDLSGLAEALVTNTLAVLKRPAVAPDWQPSAEAQQFYQEAMWARRWGLARQAQQASESAWALGQRTRAVGLLRIHSYLDNDSGYNTHRCPSPYEGNNYEYFYANNALLPTALDSKRAKKVLELFSQDEPLLTTNSSGFDSEWFSLGLRILSQVGGVLESFYYVEEARHDQEIELTDVREQTRHLVAMLETLGPADRGEIGCVDTDDNPNNGCASLIRLKWYDGGYWFDRPEEALRMHRQMVESGLHPFHLPWVIGWSWEDRKRVPVLLKQFVADLRNSTNPSVRLEGLYLEMARASLEEDSSQKELLDGIWAQRERLLTGQGDASILTRTEWMLKVKNDYAGSQNYDVSGLPSFRGEPYASFKDRLRKDFLLHGSKCDEVAFRALFSTDPVRYELAEAREFMPLLVDFKKRLALDSRQGQCVDSVLGVLVARATNSNPGSVSGSAPIRADLVGGDLTEEHAKPVRFTSLQLTGSDQEALADPVLENAVYRYGQLWLHLRCPRMGVQLWDARSFFVAVDLKTGKFEVVPFPPELGYPDPKFILNRAAFFEVAKDSLYISVQDRVVRYRLHEQRWETIPIPMEKGAAITGSEGRLYLRTGESLLELVPESRSVEILGSTRRRPAASPLDELGGFMWAFQRPAGGLVLLAGGRFFNFTPSSHKCEELPGPRLPPASIFTMQPFLCEHGLLWVFDGQGNRKYLLAVFDGNERVECLLDQPGKWPGNAQSVDTLLTRWNWPEPYLLQECLLASDGKRLWGLSPRDLGFLGTHPLSFGDDRNATVLCFAPESRAGVIVPVRFEKDDRPSNPFNPAAGGSFFRGMGKTVWLECPEGLILAGPTGAGYWLISKEDLEPRLDAPRKAPSGPIKSALKQDALMNRSSVRTTNLTGAPRP